MSNKRYNSYDNEPDAHKVVKNFRENHDDNTKNKAYYPSDEPQSSMYERHNAHLLG
jgi:hypothetical protein